MLLAERDPNASGRTSRASDFSATSRRPPSAGGTTVRTDLLSSAPGVASMLKNSTELGGLGGLTADAFGVPNMSRAPRRGGATSRLSTASSRSNTSNRASMHRAWPSSASSATRRSRENNMPQYVADTLSPTIMNLPGSSPLIPRGRQSRDGHRSFSMSMANTSEPTFRLSSNRSLASLRSQDYTQRPRSPYGYPARFRRPGYRPTSPALSDSAGQLPRRVYSYGSHSHPLHSGQGRVRPSTESSHRREDRGYPLSGLPPTESSHRREDRSYPLSGGLPPRTRTPVYYGDPAPDIPPVPPLVLRRQNVTAERSRGSQRSYRSASRRSAQVSGSSGSINQRTESDAPSSDGTSPPTPIGGAVADVLIAPAGTQMLMRNLSGIMSEKVSSSPLYYDYSEQFEQDQATEPEPNAVPHGFVHRIKTIIEERGPPDRAPKTLDVGIVENNIEGQPLESLDIAELPASPVPRRITRDLVLSALEHASTTGDVDSSGEPAESKDSIRLTRTTNEGVAKIETVDGRAASCMQQEEAIRNRHSVLSQAGSSVIDSSTLEFAVQYSIPMAAANGISIDTDDNPGPVAEPDVEPNTEDGMSDLLDGYQHTETKQDNEVTINENVAKRETADKRSNHAARSSDEQSFKSCTDLPDVTEQSAKATYAESLESCKTSSGPGMPIKDSDAKSFRTCKDAMTPDRGVLMLAPRESMLGAASPEPVSQRPFYDLPVASLPVSKESQILPSVSESSIPKVATRFRTDTRLSSKHSLAAASTTSSKRAVMHQPLLVPPRESSASQEAQRSNAVSSFLMRGLQFTRKASSGISRKPTKDDDAVKSEHINTSSDIPTPPPLRSRVLLSNVPVSTFENLEQNKTCRKVLTKQAPTATQSKSSVKKGSDAVSKECSLAKTLSIKATPNRHQHTLSTSSPLALESSSVYSPDNISSSKSRAQSSPVLLPQTPESSRLDGQGTARSSWHGTKSLSSCLEIDENDRNASPHSQEETTTDLRLSAYRYPNAMHRLPDLKEESHEDSSLNTSASNLKHSSFRLPCGPQPDFRVSRVSVDYSPMFSRTPSAKSYRKSGLSQTRGLPSMNFSNTNLLEKLGGVFDFRESRSLDLSPEDRKAIQQSDIQRPASAGGMREKYRSVFGGLYTGDATRTSIGDLFSKRRPFSPDAYMAELDQLDVPSISPLTDRLSELLPSLRHDGRDSTDDFPEDNVIMEHAMGSIKQVCRPEPKRSSARLRPIPGSPNTLIVVDDALFEDLTSKFKGGASGRSNAGGDGAKPNGLGEGGPPKSRSYSVAHPPREKTSIAEISLPSPTVLRTRSLSLGQQHQLRASESRLSSRSFHSLADTTTASFTDTRPWNSDKNYPWSSTLPSVDISLPPRSALKQSPRPGPSQLRNRLSNASSMSGTFSPCGLLDTPASPTGTMPMPMPGSDGLRPHTYYPCHQRFSIFGSSKQPNASRAVSSDASGYATEPVRVHGDNLSHGVGERYPTSALTLPANLHILPVSLSHFSVDTSDDEVQPSSSRKLRFGIKSRRNLKPSTGREEPVHVQESRQPTAAADSVHDGTSEVPVKTKRHTFSGVHGMSSVSYYKSKALDKLKGWYHKSRNFVTGRRLQNKAHPGRISTARRTSHFVEGEGTYILDYNGNPINNTSI